MNNVWKHYSNRAEIKRECATREQSDKESEWKKQMEQVIEEVTFWRVTKVQVKTIIILKRLSKMEIDTGSTNGQTVPKITSAAAEHGS